MARPKKNDRESIKTARASLAMTEALYNDISTLAQIQGVSVNDFICRQMELVVKKNRRTIDKINAALSDAFKELELTVDEKEKVD